MKVMVQGSKDFDNYQDFLLAMRSVLHDIEGHEEFILYSVGPRNINSFSQEFSNISERTFRLNRVKNKVVKVTAGWAEDNLESFDYIVYFSLPHERKTPLIRAAEDLDRRVIWQKY